ncbi:hypothetical protein FJ658_00715 [Schumannella sp. 10F1B-5-1]|nr:hypothetical protein FJ658_00715 [Schumannella sp. 10F1B-5-1]
MPAVLQHRIEVALAKRGEPAVSIMDRPAIDTVPAWVADGRRHHDEQLPAEWREQLAERHQYIGARMRERGAALALERPAWTQDLGDVPAHPRRMFEWHHTAAEIDLLRAKYRIDPNETEAIPVKLRGNDVADRLQERVTALHKAAELTTATPLEESARQRYADQTVADLTAVRARLAERDPALRADAGPSRPPSRLQRDEETRAPLKYVRRPDGSTSDRPFASAEEERDAARSNDQSLKRREADRRQREQQVRDQQQRSAQEQRELEIGRHGDGRER